MYNILEKNMSFIGSFLLMAPPPAGGDAGSASTSILPTIILFGAVILIMYFLMIRPQQKRQKEHQALLDSLKVGVKVVTTAGLYGKIDKLEEKKVVLQVENAKLTFDRAAIVSKVDN